MDFRNYETFLEQAKLAGYSIIQTPNDEILALAKNNIPIPVPAEELENIEKDVCSYLSFLLNQLYCKYDT